MKRGRRPSGSEGDNPGEGGEPLKRTTIFLPDAMNANLDYLASQTGESKATIVRQALAQFLVSQDLQPYSRPNNTSPHR